MKWPRQPVIFHLLGCSANDLGQFEMMEKKQPFMIAMCDTWELVGRCYKLQNICKVSSCFVHVLQKASLLYVVTVCHKIYITKPHKNNIYSSVVRIGIYVNKTRLIAIITFRYLRSLPTVVLIERCMSLKI